MSFREVECLTIKFLEITGQKLAIWPSSRSRWAFFWAAVSRLASGTAVSVRPLSGLAAVCFCQVASRKGKKFLSSENYGRACAPMTAAGDNVNNVVALKHLSEIQKIKSNFVWFCSILLKF